MFCSRQLRTPYGDERILSNKCVVLHRTLNRGLPITGTHSRIGKSMFGLYLLAGGRLLVLGKGCPTPTSVGITTSLVSCVHCHVNPLGIGTRKVMCEDLWTDVRGVASLTNCVGRRHFVTLPTGRTYDELPR